MSTIIKSTWNPPETVTRSNDHFTSWAKSMAPTANPQKNIPDFALRAWKKFINDERWYVVKADKGGKIVTWRREDYRAEALRQLSDKTTYQELSKTEAEGINSELLRCKLGLIDTLVTRGNITRSEAARLRLETTKIPAIYFLPKIHKAKRSDTGTFNGRPIIAAIGSMMKSLDQYLATITAPLLKEIPGSLIDTGALLRDLTSINRVPPSAQLFSADVEALYPNIPWQEGLDSATEFYRLKYLKLAREADRSNKLPPPRPDIFRAILRLTLEKNIFHFQENRWYKQLKGTAMGCSMSVFLANTFMYKRTRHLIESPPKELLYFSRYIDDIIAIFDGEGGAFEKIFYQGTIDENIKLTFVHGHKELEALDVKLTLEADGSVSSKLHRKPTDGHQFLHWASAHPKSLKKSIPYAQLLRIRRNCTHEKDFEEEAKNLLGRFRRRNYPRRVLEQALSKARLRDRDELLETAKGKSADERFTLVLDFDESEANAIRTCTNDFWAKIQKEHTTLPTEPPRLAFRLGHTLGRNLGPIFKRNRPLPEATNSMPISN